MAEKTDTKPARRRLPPIKVWVLPEEKAPIEAAARACNLSASGYLKALGLNTPIRAAVDVEAVRQIAKVNADLGRLGGLLKLWLTDDARSLGRVSDIRGLLKRIEDTQAQIRAEVGKISIRR